MKILLFFAAFALCAVSVYSQSTLPLRADTVLIEKVGGSAFLKLKDSSRNTKGGILTNIGGGVYVGKKPRRNGDTLFIGVDTFIVSSGGSLFGINDTTSAVSRSVNMNNHDFTIDNTNELNWWFKDADYQTEIYARKDFIQHFIYNATRGTSSEVTNEDSTVFLQSNARANGISTATSIRISPGLINMQSATPGGDTTTKLILRAPPIISPDSVYAKDNDTVKAVAVTDLGAMIGGGGSGDSVTYSVQSIQKGRINQINAFGNSITQYQNATPFDSSYIRLVADTLKAYLQNYALSGQGVFYAVQQHDSLIQGPNNNAATTVSIGYNDVRAVSAGYRTYKKIASGIKSMFLNHFANYYIAASTTPPDTSVTRYGTWSTAQDAVRWAGKTKNAAITSAINDSIVWKCQPATSIGIGLIAGDSLLYNHSIVELFIDGISQGQFNTNNIADSAALVGAVNTRIPYAIIVGGLSNSPHTIKLVNKASRIMFVDYFATLDSQKPSFVVFHNINPFGGSAGMVGLANAAIDSMVATLPSGFPVITVRTNDFFNPATDLDLDGIHPNNLGHHHIYDAFRAAYNINIAAAGTLKFDGRHLWISGKGTMNKLLNASDAWTKGDAAINVAGYINLPYYMSIKQNGTDILKTDENLQRTNVGYHAGYQQTTASGNTAVGNNALGSATVGGANTSVGQNALGSLTSGTNSTGIGYQAAYSSTTGDGVTAVGMYSLFSNSSGTNNTAVGKAALFANTNGSYNTAVGYEAQSTGTTGSDNSSLGYSSLKLNTGSGNVAIGIHSLENNSTGSYNVGIGRYAVFFHSLGDGNVGIGNGALYGTNNAKNYNVAIGYGSLGAVDGVDGNIGIGYNAGDNITTGARNIIIGYDIDAPVATTSNQLSIGNILFGTGLTGTGTGIAGKIGIGMNAPTARLHLAAGTSSANTAPLKLTSGTNLTTPEDGAIEYNGTHFYATIGSTRYQLDQQATIASGTYTPTLTNEANITASTAYQCQYMRVGNVVTVSGKINVDYTSTGVSSIGISLPIASSISNNYEVAGTVNAEVNNGGVIRGDATNDRAQFYIDTGSSASYDYFFVFVYTIQ